MLFAESQEIKGKLNLKGLNKCKRGQNKDTKGCMRNKFWLSCRVGGYCLGVGVGIWFWTIFNAYNT
jgi:hypothetical protein